MREMFPSENIVKLRKLTNEINNDNDYKLIVEKIKKIIEEGKEKVNSSLTSQSKIKCYETLYKKITNLLTNL